MKHSLDHVRAWLGSAAVVALAACGGGDDSPAVGSGATTPTTASAGPTTSSPTAPAPTVVAVTVRGGRVVEGAARQRAALGQPVTVRVSIDVDEEVHVHGYDKTVPVAAGRTAEVTFVADIPGVFEVELERSGRQLFTLEVR